MSEQLTWGDIYPPEQLQILLEQAREATRVFAMMQVKGKRIPAPALATALVETGTTLMIAAVGATMTHIMLVELMTTVEEQYGPAVPNEA